MALSPVFAHNMYRVCVCTLKCVCKVCVQKECVIPDMHNWLLYVEQAHYVDYNIKALEHFQF